MLLYFLETKARRGDKGYGRLGATVSLLHILYTYDINGGDDDVYSYNGGGEIEVTVTSREKVKSK